MLPEGNNKRNDSFICIQFFKQIIILLKIKDTQSIKCIQIICCHHKLNEELPNCN